MAGVVALSVVAQARPGAQGIDTLTSTRESLLVTYEEGATVVVELEGTSRLPDGEGRAEVRRRPGALLHESSLARTMPTDRILTCRYETTLVGRGRSSD